MTLTNSAHQAQPPVFRSELPVDHAAFLTPSVVLTPEYLESGACAEQLPFLFWLIDATSPAVVVDIGTSDATSYFGLCQAADAARLDTTFFLGALAPAENSDESSRRITQWVDYQNRRHAARSQIIGGGTDELGKVVSERSVDLLVLHAEGNSFARLREGIAELRTKLSPRAIIFIDGLGKREHDLFNDLDLVAPEFRFTNGTGFSVACVESSPPTLMQYLTALAGDGERARGIRSLFQRLGLGCRQEAERRDLEQACGQLLTLEKELTDRREESGLQAARLAGRECEIEELQKRLDWFREELATAHDTMETAQSSSAELRESLRQLASDLEAAKFQSRKGGRRVQSLREENAILASDLDVMRDALSRMKSDLTSEQEAFHSLRKEIESLYASRSWRATSPLRRLATLFRGGAG